MYVKKGRSTLSLTILRIDTELCVRGRIVTKKTEVMLVLNLT